MAYKIKSSKEPDYAEIELEHFAEEHRKRKPRFLEVTREGTRQATFVPEISHRKGSLVYYKEKLHIVGNSSSKGVWLHPLAKKDEVFENDKEKLKPVFIEEKKYEKKVEPVFIATPFYLSPTIAGEFPKK